MPVTFTDDEWARLEAVFPDGVCDWSKPGRGQGPAETWLRYADADGDVGVRRTRPARRTGPLGDRLVEHRLPLPVEAMKGTRCPSTRSPTRSPSNASIPAEPEVIFDLLARPERHAEFDGSGTVRQARSSGRRVGLGDSFGMDMKWGISYSTRNVVREFVDGRRIAWQTLAPAPLHMLFTGRTWRYELSPPTAAPWCARPGTSAPSTPSPGGCCADGSAG